MSEPAVRVAVQHGAYAVRVAAIGPSGAPQVLARVRGPATPEQTAALLADLFGPVPLDLVVVRDRAAGPPVLAQDAHEACAATTAGGPDPPAPAPSAHVFGGGSGPPPGRVGRAGGAPAARGGLVVDVGHGGASVTLLAADGRCLAAHRGPVGGARLDAAVAALLCPPDGAGVPLDTARQAREALSLMPTVTVRAPGGEEYLLDAAEVRSALTPLLGEIVESARTVAGGERVPVRLIGGVARTPLLAELLDAAGIGPVTVAARPDEAAVLGALRLPAPARPEEIHGERRWFAPPPRRRRWGTITVLATVAALAALSVLSVLSVLPARSSPPKPDVAAGVVAQYGYALRVPDGWAHIGGLPERRRTLLAPAARPDGSDLVTVERTALGYDAAAEPARARTDLRAAFDAAVAAGAALSDFVPATGHAGRPVATYRERGAAGTVDWYVLLDVSDQISVGCQHTSVGADEVARACSVVVGSVRPH